MPGALLGPHPSVVRQCVQTIRHQTLGQVLDRPAALAVDDGTCPVQPPQTVQQFRVGPLVLGEDCIVQVRPVETGDVNVRIAQLQLHQNVPADALGGRGGERQGRQGRKALAHCRKLAVLRPKVMAPFAHAVRLIDCQKR